MAYQTDRGILRVFVSDPGPGHGFFPEPGAAADLERGHRGLQLISGLSREVEVSRRGAELRIDLDMAFYPPAPQGTS